MVLQSLRVIFYHTTLADRFGFRRWLASVYLLLSVGSFLLGSLSASWVAPLRDAMPLYGLVFAILMVPSLGPSIVKPVVVGTTARGRRGSPFTEAPAGFRA